MSINILIVDDEENARKNVGKFLQSKGYEVNGVGTLKEARVALQRGDGDVVLLDVQLPDGFGLTLLNEVSQLPFKPPIIVITGYGDIEMAVEAMKNGAHDFITKPIVDFDALEFSIKRASEIVQMRRELAHLRQNQIGKINFVIGNNREIKIIIEQALKAAKSSVSVLITGETGTGKEILAQLIHQSGPRSDKPFIAVNCGAIQPTILESELFGYEAGAFTGAEKRKHGLIARPQP